MNATTYNTEMRIWSRVGYTPLTHRVGCYCDLLLETTIPTESPKDAKEKLKALMRSTRHSASGHYIMTDYPNQNTRSAFIHNEN